MTATEGSDSEVRLRTAFAAALRDFWQGLPALIAFDLLIRITGLVVIAPLTGWLVRQIVEQSGNLAVGNLDIARILLTPFGLATALLISVLMLAVSFAEFAGLMAIGYGAACQRQLTYLAAGRLVWQQLGRIAQLSAATVVLATGIVMPALAVAGWVAVRLLGAHDVNYYLDARPGEFRWTVGVGILLGTACGVALAFAFLYVVFALPVVLLRGRAVGGALRESRRMLLGRRGFVMGMALVWIGGWALASLAFNWLGYEVASMLTAACGGDIRWLLPTLAGIATAGVVLNTVVSFLFRSLTCLVIVRLFCEACRADGLPLVELPEHRVASGTGRGGGVSKLLPVAIAALVLAVSVFVARGLVESRGLKERVEIIAHRGSSLAAPENTLAAVRRAIDEQATVVEVDVQRTADGVLVVNHDADLMRVAGVPLVIAETNYADLARIRVDRHRGRESAVEKVPTLDEVLDACNGRVKVIVEIKSYHGDAERLVLDVVTALRRRGLGVSALVMSLAYDEVQRAKALDPSLTAGFVASAALGDLTRLDTDFLAVSASKATEVFVSSAHASGRKVFVWTVDEPREMSMLIDRGVDGIITNDPAALVRVLAERTKLSNTERLLLRFGSLYGKGRS